MLPTHSVSFFFFFLVAFFVVKSDRICYLVIQLNILSRMLNNHIMKGDLFSFDCSAGVVFSKIVRTFKSGNFIILYFIATNSRYFQALYILKLTNIWKWRRIDQLMLVEVMQLLHWHLWIRKTLKLIVEAKVYHQCVCQVTF